MSEQPSPTPSPAPSPSPAPAPAEHVDPSLTVQPKPENLPERYYDATTGLRTKEIGDTLTAYEAEQAKHATTFKDFPAKPEDAGKFYTLPENLLPEGVKLPDGVKIEPDTVLLAAALPILHKHKVAPELFQELARAVTANNVEKFVAANAEFAEDNKKLGANADTRRAALASTLAARVGPDRAKFLDTGALTSQAVEFFEQLLKDPSSAPLNPRRDGDPPPVPKTVEQRWYPPVGAQQQRA